MPVPDAPACFAAKRLACGCWQVRPPAAWRARAKCRQVAASPLRGPRQAFACLRDRARCAAQSRANAAGMGDNGWLQEVEGRKARRGGFEFLRSGACGRERTVRARGRGAQAGLRLRLRVHRADGVHRRAPQVDIQRGRHGRALPAHRAGSGARHRWHRDQGRQAHDVRGHRRADRPARILVLSRSSSPKTSTASARCRSRKAGAWWVRSCARSAP